MTASTTLRDPGSAAAASSAPRLAFGGVVSSELLKLSTLASMRWLALASAGAAVLGAVAFAADERATPAMAVSGAASLAALLVGIMTALSVTSEYATGSIRTTLTVAPRRVATLLAKAVAAAVVGGALSIVGTVAGLALVSSMHPAGWLHLVDVAPHVVGAAVYVALSAVVCLMLGAVLRGVAAATAGVIVLVLLLPAMAGGVRVGDSYLSDYLLAEAGPSLVGTSTLGGDTVVDLTIVSAWIVVGTLAGVLRLTRGDA